MHVGWCLDLVQSLLIFESQVPKWLEEYISLWCRNCKIWARWMFLSAGCTSPRKPVDGRFFWWPSSSWPLFCQEQFKLSSFLPRAVQVVPFLSWHKFTLCWVSITTACRWNMNFFWHKYKAARITVTRFFLVVGQISHDLDNKRCLQLLLWIYLEVLFNLSGEVEQE